MLLSPATLTPPGASPLHRHNEAHISLNNARPSQNAVGLLFCVVSCLCVIDVYFPVWVFECVCALRVSVLCISAKPWVWLILYLSPCNTHAQTHSFAHAQTHTHVLSRLLCVTSSISFFKGPSRCPQVDRTVTIGDATL